MTNTTVLAGYIANDPVLSKAKSGTSILKFRLRTEKPGNLKDEQGRKLAMFLTVKLFGARADTMATMLMNRKPITVSGTLDLDEYEKDGATRMEVIILADKIDFALPDDTRTGAVAQAPAAAAAAPAQPSLPDTDSLMDIYPG